MDRDDVEDIYVLSPMQKGMLFHTLYAPRSGVYVQQTVYALRGDLSVPAFVRAWERVVERHPILRTFFLWERRDEPLQVVRRRVDVPWAQEDWRGLSPVEQQARLHAYLEADRERGFDLSRPPLMRLALIRLAEDACHFIWSRHHLLLDRWSSTLVLREVLACHGAYRSGENPQLEAARPYRDYIAWLRRQDRGRAEAFWRETLKDVTAPTPLGIDRADGGPPGGEIIYDRQELRMPSATTAALRSLARRHRLTPNTLVQGAWALILSRYSGEDDVVLGVTVSGRPADLAGVESIAGLFINTLPVRVRVSPEDRLVPWLQRLQDQMLELREYEHSPLVEIRSCSDIPPGQPLFESILVSQDPMMAGAPDEAGQRLEARVVWAKGDRTGYPLTMRTLSGEALALRVTYDRRRLHPVLMTRMLGHFQTVLEGIAADPEQRCVALPLLTEAERRQLLVEWNQTRVADFPNACLHQLFEAQAARTPDAVAVVYEDQRLTYRALDARASRLARQLRTLRVGPDTLVGLCVERSLDMVVGVLGILKAGGAYVPLDPNHPPERLAFVLADARAAVLLTQTPLRARLPQHAIPTLCLDAADPALDTDEPGVAAASDVGPEHLAYVIYTSGSTGRPKGVEIPHRAVVNFLEAMRREPGLTADDTLLAVTTLSFDIATLELLLPLSVGARVVIAGADAVRDGAGLGRLLAEWGVTVMQATPGTWRLLLEAGWAGTPGLRVLCGGETLSRDLAAALRTRTAAVWNLYGPTETTIYSTAHLVGPDEDPVPIGKPIANTQVYVLDRRMQPVPVGAPGELHIGGVGVARGYLRRPELTAERFVADPFRGEPGARLYKTGDVARYSLDGTLEFLGRLDHQVKLRGHRVEPGEIEAVLGQHPGVREAVVLAREDVPGDPRLVAYVVPTREAPPAWTDLHSFLQAKLPPYMVPAAFVFLDALPLTPNRKLDRRALPAPDPARHDRERTRVAPRDPLERELARIWEDLLDVRPIGVTDDFFALGGHSLLAVRLTARIHRQLGRQLPLSSLFPNASIERLATLLRGSAVARHESTVTGHHRNGARPPFFCVHPAGGSVLCYAELTRCLGPHQPFYALQHPGLDGESEPFASLEEMAGHYVAALRSVQPEGPYLLGGWSLGGIIAFEMAQQLQALGQKVARLAVLDVSAHAPEALATAAVEATAALGLIRDLGFDVSQVSLTPEDLLRLAPDERLPYLWDRLKAARSSPPEIGPPELERHLRVLQANLGARRAYRPRTYPGRVVLLRASERPAGAPPEPTLGWGTLAAGGVEIHVVPGSHHTMLREPHVKVLAQQLRAILTGNGTG